MKKAVLTKDFAPWRKMREISLRDIGLFRIIILKWTVKAYDIRIGTALVAQNGTQRRVIDNRHKYSGFNERINSIEQIGYREFRKRLLL
jgi:Trm5-related predicted tRNA methylase